MPELDWKAFRALPGASWRNWELLCHGLIHRNYGGYGKLVAVRVQPVVEFHLTLTKDCPGLGKRGEQWGWQCKFWDEDSPKLNASRKKVLTKAFKNQPTHLPELDHLVIWTHQALRKTDWQWIEENAPDGVEVHSWWDDHVSNLLVGDAEPLAETYFGAAVLDPDQLRTAHEEAKATLRGLTPEIHITVKEERVLRRLRGRAGDWGAIAERAQRLSAQLEAIERLPPSALGKSYTEVMDDLVHEVRQAIEVAEEVTDHLQKGLTFKVTELAEQAPPPRDASARGPVQDLEHRLDAAGENDHRHAVGALSTTLAATAQLLQRLAADLRMPLVAVDGRVGAGKTQLSARLSAPSGDDPAGALVPAKSFRNAEIDLDRLASLAGLRAMPVDDLLEALDAAGARAGQRLPLVIDGLHESRAATAWRDALARLTKKVKRYNNVFVLVTLRPSYAEDCLPDDRGSLTLGGFRLQWREACARYFELYRIRADLDLLPAGRFSDPLFVRVFCEATNPRQQESVDLGTVPPSLVEALERYVTQAIGRIRDELRIDPVALAQRIRRLAEAYWTRDARALPLQEAKQLLGDDEFALDTSVAYALEEEGILDRDRSPAGEIVSPMFDALGGYLIADALLPTGQARDAALSAIEGRLDGADAHPLAEDIRQALGHLFAVRARISLRETTADEPLRRAATLDLLTADPATVTTDDAAAVSALVAGGATLGEQWSVVLRNRAVPGHPFDARWLDRTLRPLGVAHRDLDWTESLRESAEALTVEVQELTARWRQGETGDGDELHLRALAWMLTSTDRALRDLVTEAVYWFGRHRPQELHDLALEMLGVNDPYVPERLMAAAYGVAMANQIATPAWRAAIPSFLDELDDALLQPAEGAAGPAHWLLREYALGVRRLVCELHPGLAGGREALDHPAVPLPAPPSEPLDDQDDRYRDARRTLGMDFHNYTLGRLVEGRSNYDFDHAGHKRVVGEVLGRVWDLGWRAAAFAGVDDAIARPAMRRHELDAARVDRYGKKYGWIGYFEAAGRRAHAGELSRERLPDVDIDPSFPQAPQQLPIALPSWVKSRHSTQERWVKGGRVVVRDELLVPQALDDAAGPWVCVDGYLRVEDEASGRKVFTFIWGALVPAGRWGSFAAALAKGGIGRHLMPEPVGDYYTFAGEIPWAPSFAQNLRVDGFPGAPVETYELGDGDALELVGLAHEYAWESYHTITTQDVTATVPSRAMCERLGLRGLPQVFDLAEAGGQLASRSMGAPPGYEGRLLYVRADLLKRYTKETGTEMGWVIWGEREVDVDWNAPPAWYGAARRAAEDQHRRVVSLEELGNTPVDPSR